MRHTESPHVTSGDPRSAARNARAASIVAAVAAIIVAVLLIVADVSAEPSELSPTHGVEDVEPQ